MTLSRSLRRPLAVAAFAVALAGCSATNPIQTDRDYAAADGVQVTLGDLRAENLFAVTTEAGAPGALSGALVNDGDVDAQVTLTVGGQGVALVVPAHSSVLLGTGSDRGETAPLEAVEVAPGAMADLTIEVDVAGSANLRIPVLDGTRSPYDAVLAR